MFNAEESARTEQYIDNCIVVLLYYWYQPLVATLSLLRAPPQGFPQKDDISVVLSYSFFLFFGTYLQHTVINNNHQQI